MTYMTPSDRALRGTSLRQRLSALATSLAERRAQHRAYRSTVAELSALSHRDLTDMGIAHADIHEIARQAAYKG
jgi:uncharacterized protein YjiS (DUF1127 family)